METKLISIIFLLALVTSGCMDNGEDPSTNMNLPNRGLVIQDLSIRDTDGELRPGQQTDIVGKFKNYHTSIRNLEIELQDTGELTVNQKICNPEPSNLDNASRGYIPEIECVWTIEAPEDSTLQGFNSMPQPVVLNLKYKGALRNKNSFTVEFKESSEIESTQTISKSFSNGELSSEIVVDSPVNSDSGTVLEMSLSNAGDGRIGDTYNINYNPDNLFKSSCPTNPEPVESSSWTGTCLLQGPSGSKNLFFTIHYKYTQTETLDITIVNRQ